MTFPLKDGVYIMSGNGSRWADFEGPFTPKEAVDQLAQMCGDYTTPELLKQVLVVVENEMIDLFKDDNGNPVNGNVIYWKNTIIVNDEVLFSDPRK